MIRMYAAALFFIATLTSAFADEKILVLLNSRNDMNITARFAKEGVRLGRLAHGKPGRKHPRFVFVDFDDSVILAARQIENAVETHKPIAMIGTIRSDHAVIAAEIAERKKIPFLAPLSTNPRVTEGKSYTFRTCFDDNQQASLLASFIVGERSRRRIAVLYNRAQVFSVGFDQLIRENLARYKDVTFVSSGYGSEKDIAQLASTELRAFKPDAVVVPAYQTEAANILNILMRSLPAGVDYFGPDSWGGGKLFNALLKPPASDSTRAFYAEHWSKDLDSEGNRKFLSLYRQNPPTAPELRPDDSADLAPIAAFYEATDFLLTAFEGSNLREPLVSALPNLKYGGPRGAIHLSSSPSPRKPIHIFELAKGGEKFLGTYSEKGWTKP